MKQLFLFDTNHACGGSESTDNSDDSIIGSVQLLIFKLKFHKHYIQTLAFPFPEKLYKLPDNINNNYFRHKLYCWILYFFISNY